MSMKKLGEGLYRYKGYEVTRDNEGNYISKVRFTNLQLSGTVLGTSQRNFIKQFKECEKMWGEAMKVEKKRDK